MLLAKDDIAGGIRELEQVVKEAPSMVRARYQLAMARIRENKADRAAAELAECLRYQPEFIQARYVLAQLHFKAGSFELAIEEANRVLAAVPKSYEMWLLVSDAALAHRDLLGAQSAAEHLIRISRTVRAVTSGWATCWAIKGSSQKHAPSWSGRCKSTPRRSRSLQISSP